MAADTPSRSRPTETEPSSWIYADVTAWFHELPQRPIPELVRDCVAKALRMVQPAPSGSETAQSDEQRERLLAALHRWANGGTLRVKIALDAMFAFMPKSERETPETTHFTAAVYDLCEAVAADAQLNTRAPSSGAGATDSADAVRFRLWEVGARAEDVLAGRLLSLEERVRVKVSLAEALAAAPLQDGDETLTFVQHNYGHGRPVVRVPRPFLEAPADG